jgi:1-acyl-sn-glycerol-3-phosphate acyltransferase
MFDDIRPFSDDEVAGVVHNLVRNRSFLDFIAKWLLPGLYGWVPSLARLGVSVYFRYHLGRVSSIREFQQGVSHVARKIVDETTDGFTFEGIENLDPNENYIFISNHRDIAGDSMLLDYGLYLNDRDTVRIAVGDNLVQIGFATDLMKLNKSFFIKRSAEGAKKIYAALLQSSQYIHHSLHTGHSIWIAQSEGRAKDGMDRTDPAIIKMFALADRKADFDALIASLHIVPMAISYEFDPCDVSKAIELQAIATDGNYVKPEGADLANLARGLGGYKGRVVLRLGTPIAGDFGSAEAVASEVDRQIRQNLELFPINYWALGEQGEATTDITLSPEQVEMFEERMALCPPEARAQWLLMYANPVRNSLSRKP